MEEAVKQARPRGRPRLPPSAAPTNTVQALDRGLNLLRTLSEQGSTTLTELAHSMDMPPSTAHRLLTTLQKHGFADLDPGAQEWTVGLEAFRVGNAYLDRTNLIESARKVMRQLTDETGETANLGIADGGDVVFISQVETHNPIRAFFRPGTRGHMHASGIGKVLLANTPRYEVEKILRQKGCPEFTPKTLVSAEDLFADLKQTKARGWSFDDEEHYMGMRCIAAAIYNSFGEAIAGISVSGPSVRFPDHLISEIGPKVKQAADQVTLVMGGKI
ncbi:MAG: IclR family acetate operon transcriptional repressor [Gammaproteobacteria bacterium]|jgi:IclR family acetate operon transcriptional repressor